VARVGHPRWIPSPHRTTATTSSGASKPAAFIAHWSQGQSPQQRAFVALGLGEQSWQSSTDRHPGREQATRSRSSHGFALESSFASGVKGGDSRSIGELQGIDAGSPPELHDSALVWFDPQLGWVTPGQNVVQSQSTLDKVAMVAAKARRSMTTAT
jgi:hypothetical protein